MDIVNGYPCKDCTDIELAKKGIDPKNPKLADGKPADPATKNAEVKQKAAELGLNEPLAAGEVATILNTLG